MKILIKKDGEGFLAEVKGSRNLFAYGKTIKDAKIELLNVTDMMLDYHLEQVEVDRKVKNELLKDNSYAI